ncbi:Uncharacterised protein [Zhongshania aliphaticivorans]|uniref:Uncharacterized protein n=1 Tax=Zhongshania aliphaticivorans TaxID=1470434 RepID=A0A5S9NHJ9_9GAMM|nr:hypothetical protein [Zhongshania aliphaticivorans]CAA0089200.1 Uncharacterised protein [Zhongshania aliphaticivorans]CAA0095883.1 Uncharacterised protein [Zhongshania aliphaticivorans]
MLTKFQDDWILSRHSRLGLLITVVFLLQASLASNVTAQGDNDLPVVKMSPEMRVEHTQEQLIGKLPCGKLAGVTVHTRAEEQALRQRKQECLAQYRQFTPIKAIR